MSREPLHRPSRPADLSHLKLAQSDLRKAIERLRAEKEASTGWPDSDLGQAMTATSRVIRIVEQAIKTRTM